MSVSWQTGLLAVNWPMKPSASADKSLETDSEEGEMGCAKILAHQSLAGRVASEAIVISRYELTCLVRQNERWAALQSQHTSLSAVT
jgi:hypothetical protein